MFDLKPTLAQTWHLSRGNGWRLAIVLGGLPWRLRAFQTVLAPDEVSLTAVVLSSLLFCRLLVVEIAAVSRSYRHLTQNTWSRFKETLELMLEVVVIEPAGQSKKIASVLVSLVLICSGCASNHHNL